MKEKKVKPMNMDIGISDADRKKIGLYAVLCGTPLPHFADAGLKG